ncbi:MAG: hypothetical protein HY565_03365 [Candidatus Kerfeldbacteria bacterium]|nr:hypothetical protein [Candidatus Kerfeldbacteria bacterium]
MGEPKGIRLETVKRPATPAELEAMAEETKLRQEIGELPYDPAEIEETTRLGAHQEHSDAGVDDKDVEKAA